MLPNLGSGYLGSPDVLLSTANQEIVPQDVNIQGDSTYFYKFSFVNMEICHVQINGSDPIYLDATQGFEMTEVDAPLTSFIIVESGINYIYIGCYKSYKTN